MSESQCIVFENPRECEFCRDDGNVETGIAYFMAPEWNTILIERDTGKFEYICLGNVTMLDRGVSDEGE